MSDHVASGDGGLTAMEEVKKLGFLTKDGASSHDGNHQDWQKHKFLFSNNEAEDGDKKECRICHEDEFVENLEAPCACNGSLKVLTMAILMQMAHRSCIQKWCNEKRSIICEICKQPYHDGYTFSSSVHQTILDVNDNDSWDEEVFIRSRLFPAVEPLRIFGINPYDGLTPGDRVKAVIILAILLIVRQSYC
ncbi:hypothetical protein L1887_13858 [Cichorium endivia]|nr:hypothetical protein L1887_13858 [Cichorium endivia]